MEFKAETLIASCSNLVEYPYMRGLGVGKSLYGVERNLTAFFGDVPDGRRDDPRPSHLCSFLID